MDRTKGAPTLPAPKPRSTVLALGGPIDRADIPRLCAALQAMLEGGGVEIVVCDVGALDRPDAVTIDALARLQLTARRLGCRLRLRHASPELRELVAFMGLRRSLRFG